MTTATIQAGLHEHLLDAVSDGALICDADGVALWANRAVGEVLGVVEQIRHTPLSRWFNEAKKIEELLAEAAKGGGKSRSAVTVAAGSGSDILVTVHAAPKPGLVLVVLRPFQSAVASFDRAISFATRDPVTRLLNRDAFQEMLAAAMERSQAGALLCANVNQFSTVNEVYGNAAGDSLLREVAHRLRASAPSEKQICRLYGGRFALFLTGEQPAAVRAVAAARAHSIHTAFAEPVAVGDGSQPISLSVGLASWPDDATTADELIGATESAIGALSRQGGDGTRWFEPALRTERRRFLEIEADLRHAIAYHQLSLHYQPKVRWADRQVVGFEALVRWNHPLKGMISPGAFVPVAEQSSLIIDLGRWVMSEVCRQQAEWRDCGLAILPIAVNVSPTQLLAQPVQTLLAPLTEHGLPLDCIDIEITETAMMDKLSAANAVIESLRQCGLHISIDDFGTGHSSLGNLRRLPIDVLKIDRSFVEDIEQSPEAHDIVATIVAMAKALSLDVIAEGVETEPQAAVLRDHGVEIMQGYLFARPMPAAEAAALLQPAAKG